MAKHIRILSDCPKCGTEMTGVYKNLPPFDEEHPWGSGIDGWWMCNNCGYESEHIDHKPYVEEFTEEV